MVTYFLPAVFVLFFSQVLSNTLNVNDSFKHINSKEERKMNNISEIRAKFGAETLKSVKIYNDKVAVDIDKASHLEQTCQKTKFFFAKIKRTIGYIIGCEWMKSPPGESRKYARNRRRKDMHWQFSYKRRKGKRRIKIGTYLARIREQIPEADFDTREQKLFKAYKNLLPNTSKYDRRGKIAVSLLAMQAVAFSTSFKGTRSTKFDTDSGDVGIDNRCSACISHKVDDFVGDLRETNRVIKGYGGTKTANLMVGTIKWNILDDEGMPHEFLIPNSYYSPQGGVRLLSPQHWAKVQKGNKKHLKPFSRTTATDVTLVWNNQASKLTVPLSKESNVATLRLSPGYEKFHAFCAECESNSNKEDYNPLLVNAVGVVSDNESDDEIEESELQDKVQNEWPKNPTKMTWKLKEAPAVVEIEEDRLPDTDTSQLLRYHQQFGHISFAKLQAMAKVGIIPSKLAKCNIPVCVACMYAKAHKKPWRSKLPKEKPKPAPTKPGELVSVDQLTSPTPGLIAQMTGILTTKRYKYATVFVDQASRLGYVYLQKTANVEETLEAKLAFELYSEHRGVKIQAYHADNGVFRANKWIEACHKKSQKLTFAGVNAHHSNGLAEKRIRDLQDHARTMLIHANNRWKKCITANLWPYAVREANNAINHTPNMKDNDKRSPYQIFTDTKVNVNPKHFKPFGCPVYILENELQQNKPYHKWKQRSKVGIYLGKSEQHGRNVSLVLNRTTGLVSPAFHVKHDSSFHSVKQDHFDSLWQIKAGLVKATPTPPPTIETQKRKEVTFNLNSEQSHDTSRKRKATEELQHNSKDKDSTKEVRKEPEGEPTKVPSKPKTVQPHIEAMLTEISEVTKDDIEGEIFCLSALFPDREDTEENPLLAFKANADPDTLYHHEAMKQPDRKEFIKSMQKEVDDQMKNNNFTVIKRELVPEGEKIFPAVWQMRRKREILTGAIKKHKARLNFDGSKSKKGIHYDQTYAPVASWTSVRLLLTLVCVHGWKTQQLDFVSAFTQAPIDKELYMEIPRGIQVEGADNPKDYCLKIHKNIYGQKSAGRTWNQYLVKKLTQELGFTQSKIDECVFYRGRTMYVLYTDDSILAGPSQKEIDQIIEDIRKAKLEITIEGTLEDFLGVNIDRREDGTIHLSQPQLISQILKDLKMDEDRTNEKDTPASSSKLLSRHSDSEDFDKSFHYRSIIGKLNYLEKGSRSDIAYITHQCARFTTAPKEEHGKAIRWLARYLKGSRDKGTILKPNKSRDLELYVDADFAGNWDSKETQDRDTARSRHGYFIFYKGCPILWKSQLQTEISLSSTESEYTGLSYALRDVIPIMNLLKEMKEQGFPIESTTPQVKCKVFEDNSGALEMAKVHKYRPRTKHLNNRLHHFRDYVSRGEIEILPIDTKEQLADYLTKALNFATLSYLRKKVMGW
ncbi:hypothetical protein CTEN210_09405 [Chaetoceros tenuissimus]|uniref:Integrase catalytic domain-containing protein n=1 Tax=Chaetoceros tenuissimus TaxID=426638 RepID=A0AAD3CW21_9STRA|nr:hypothetical protein CTEN210_09405 [Chaetoceros tenuissimus]